MGRRLRAAAQAVAFWAVVAALLAYTLFPFYWAVLGAVQPAERLFRLPVTYWPAAPTGENFARVLASEDFLIALLNSALVCTGAVALSLALGALAAFALGRLAFRGRRAMRYLVLGMTMFPQIAVLGGLYAMINALGAGAKGQASEQFVINFLTDIERAVLGFCAERVPEIDMPSQKLVFLCKA